MRHNILFKEKKSDNPINEKKIILPPKKYHIYYFIIVLEIYAIKSLLDFSMSRIIISYINYILVFNF
jgi:hypothetical protein